MKINKYIILFVIIIFLIYLYNCYYFKETFLDYETERAYYYCKYNRDSESCHNYQNRVNILNDTTKKVGYIIDLKNNSKHNLYSYYNINYRKQCYTAGILNNNSELKIDLPFNINYLNTNNIVQIPSLHNKYKVFIYDPDIDRLNYVGIPWTECGYIVNNDNTFGDEYYKVYKKRKNRFYDIYGIYDKDHILIQLNNKKLYNNDTVKINGKVYTFYSKKYSLF